MSSLRLFVLAFAISIVVPACATDDGTADDLAGTTSQDGVDVGDKADASGVYTYFVVRPDLYRKCAWPVCGGKFLHRANLGTTKCNDGVYRSECYVVEIDTSALGLSDSDLGKVTDAASRNDTSVLLKGTIGTRTYNGTKLGVFKATEAWLAGSPSSTPDGVFVKIHDNGVRCFAAPCSNLEEDKLNSSRDALLADVEYLTGATDRELETIQDKYVSDGVIIAGDRYTVHANGKSAKGRTATQYWTKVEGACYVGGCSGQLCSDQPGAISTCQWKAEYACYQDATCERQLDGACGWTQTDDLLACLADPTGV